MSVPGVSFIVTVELIESSALLVVSFLMERQTYRMYSYFIDPALKDWKLLGLTIDVGDFYSIKKVKAELK